MPTRKPTFKEHVPMQYVYDLLDSICQKTDTYYLINYTAYKKIQYYQLYPDFIDKIKEYYYSYKHEILFQKLTYMSFVALIQQICKHNEVPVVIENNYKTASEYFAYYVFFST
jgi:hypothetical protein